MARWATLLSKYHFDIKYRPGVEMDLIDALSRALISTPLDTEMEILDSHLEVFITMSEEEQVVSMQRTDTRLRAIMDILNREQSGRSTADAEGVKDYQLVN